eukprot:3291136-Amphidinium_carterae.2
MHAEAGTPRYGLPQGPYINDLSQLKPAGPPSVHTKHMLTNDGMDNTRHRKNAPCSPRKNSMLTVR